MMLKSQKYNVLSIFSTLVYILLHLTLATNASPSNVTALFVLGDSTVDPGNNLYIPTKARADHPPYGRDLPDHKPSGRYTNGKLVTDFLSSCLGLKEFLPPYLDPKLSDDELISGASFASAGMGLDEITCLRSNVMNISTQLDNFDEAVERIQKKLGSREVTRVISDAVFLVSAGTNDMLANMYNLRTRRPEYSVPQYHDFLLRKIKSTIERLYNAGARKIAIVGHPPMGCLPLQVTLSAKIPRSCVDSQNEDSRDYNSKLNDLLLTITRSNSLKDIKLAYLDIYTPVMEMIDQPAIYGFERTLQGCCSTGLFEFGSTCNIFSLTCNKAFKFLFFDAIHPSEAAYEHISETMCTTLGKMFA